MTYYMGFVLGKACKVAWVLVGIPLKYLLLFLGNACVIMAMVVSRQHRID